MDPRRKDIEQNESEIGRLEQQITTECILIGKRISELDHHTVRSTELQKYLNNIDSLRKTIDAYQQDIVRIQGLVRRLQELQQQASDNQKRRKEVLKERESRFVEIGAGSFSLFKSLTDRAKYRTFFEELLKLEADMDRMQAELKELEEQEKDKGFLEKLFKYKSRKFAVRSDLNRSEKEKLRALGESGRRLADSDFETITTGDLKAIFALDGDKKKELDKIAVDDAQVRAELEKTQGELRKFGIQDDSVEKIRETEKRIADVQRELDVMYCWTGQLFLERDLRPELPDTTLGAKFDIIAGVRESIRKRHGNIYRLKAELEIEDLAKKEKNLRQRRKQLEEEMRIKERQIGVIDLELSIGQRRLEDLRRV
ncbi:MAG: hypothetical protein HYY17_14220, partial [Planctomycetes bacterium]|nr:hypothetical protein [Planctomycetota bacterium]